MKRIRVAGLVEMGEGIALMHRTNVQPSEEGKPFGEYYVFAGGGIEEEDASLEEAVKREILEEFGIVVEVKQQVCYREIKDKLDEYLFYCKYISGELGTGTGPEFSNDPRYTYRGNYIPTIIKKEDVKNIRLFPDEFKQNVMDIIERKDSFDK